MERRKFSREFKLEAVRLARERAALRQGCFQPGHEVRNGFPTEVLCLQKIAKRNAREVGHGLYF
ncbi:MAG: hypothetical protein JWR51_25 [Devosia sp.]|nr:hypothetical protein [Devosia sp.]